MIFPKSTIIDKKITKQSFYDHADIKAPLRKKFIDQIERITFSNKFSKETLNIPKTDEVEEIFVFDVTLKDNIYLDKIEDVLSVIDKSVPYPILYRFKVGSSVVYKIAHKIRNKNDINKTVVDVYFTKKVIIEAQKLFEKEFNICFNALNLKTLYDNILRLFLTNKKDSIEASIKEQKDQIYLTTEIDRLNTLMVKEKQADKQYELHCKINILRGQIEHEN